MSKDKRITWTEEELNFLLENAGKLTNKEMAQKLDRQVKQVYNRMVRFLKSRVISQEDFQKSKGVSLTVSEMIDEQAKAIDIQKIKERDREKVLDKCSCERDIKEFSVEIGRKCKIKKLLPNGVYDSRRGVVVGDYPHIVRFKYSTGVTETFHKIDFVNKECDIEYMV